MSLEEPEVDGKARYKNNENGDGLATPNKGVHKSRAPVRRED
jgi:hypothetical protein